MRSRKELLDWLRSQLSASCRHEKVSIDVINLKASLLVARFESELSEDDWFLLKNLAMIHYENVPTSFLGRLDRLVELGLIRTARSVKDTNYTNATYAKSTPLGIAVAIRHLELSEAEL